MADDDEDLARLIGAEVAGKYRVERLIGRGGMGAVYEATNAAIGKSVALKFLDRDAARDADAVARFQREAQSASAVDSAHIVQIFDSGTSDGRPYLVMELLRGEDLRARLRRETRLGVADTLHIAAQVLRGLARAHASGIVHRDLKPDNIFLAERDDDAMFVKIVDFGISKVTRRHVTADTLTRRGTVLGTAFYMAPEQAQAFPDVDGQADLWSLGAIMFECLTGKPPHTGTAYEAILVSICTKDAADVREGAPDVPKAVAEVIARALARERTQRFLSAEAMHGALHAAAPTLVGAGPVSARSRVASRPALGATPRVATEDGAAVRPRQDATRARTVVIALVAALAAFALTAFLMTRGAPSPTDAPAPAVQPETPFASRTDSTGLPNGPVVVPVAAPSAGADGSRLGLATTRSSSVSRPAAHKGQAPAASASPSTKVQGKGVVSGLELDTSGP